MGNWQHFYLTYCLSIWHLWINWSSVQEKKIFLDIRNIYLCEFIHIKYKHPSISTRQTTYIRFFLANQVCVYVIFIYDKREVPAESQPPSRQSCFSLVCLTKSLLTNGLSSPGAGHPKICSGMFCLWDWPSLLVLQSLPSLKVSGLFHAGVYGESWAHLAISGKNSVDLSKPGFHSQSMEDFYRYTNNTPSISLNWSLPLLQCP